MDLVLKCDYHRLVVYNAVNIIQHFSFANPLDVLVVMVVIKVNKLTIELFIVLYF